MICLSYIVRILNFNTYLSAFSHLLEINSECYIADAFGSVNKLNNPAGT